MSSKNVGDLDRFIRLLIVVGLGYWGYATGSWLIFAIGGLLLITVFTGRCLLYTIAKTGTVPDLKKMEYKDVRYRPESKR